MGLLLRLLLTGVISSQTELFLNGVVSEVNGVVSQSTMISWSIIVIYYYLVARL